MSALREDVAEEFEIPAEGLPPALEFSEEAARELRRIYPGAQQFYAPSEVAAWVVD
jgi:hypothetical protein